MLGVIIAVVLGVGMCIGLEMGSPGTLAAVVKAIVLVFHHAQTHTGAHICEQLQRLGDSTPLCPAPV